MRLTVSIIRRALALVFVLLEAALLGLARIAEWVAGQLHPPLRAEASG